MQDQDYILFETYLLEELSQEDVASFESRLKTDSEFNEAFNSYKALSSFLEHKQKRKDSPFKNAYGQRIPPRTAPRACYSVSHCCRRETR